LSTLLLCIALVAPLVVGDTVTLPTSGGTLTPGWWLTYGETITSCTVTGFASNPSCSVHSQHQITVGGGTAGTSGTITVAVSDGQFAIGLLYTSSCSGVCFHGTCTGSNTCSCDFGWSGSDCQSLTYLITSPTAGGLVAPISWLSSSETITGCVITGIAPVPWCYPTGQHQIRLPPGTGTVGITVTVNDGWIGVPLNYNPTLTTACVNGRVSDSNTQCTCQTGWTGADCNTGVCDPAVNCNHGSCNTGTATCQCSSGWQNDNSGNFCNIKSCNCNGLGTGCSCTSSQCLYTSCGAASLPGWSQTAVCTQACNK